MKNVRMLLIMLMFVCSSVFAMSFKQLKAIFEEAGKNINGFTVVRENGLMEIVVPIANGQGPVIIAQVDVNSFNNDWVVIQDPAGIATQDGEVIPENLISLLRVREGFSLFHPSTYPAVGGLFGAGQQAGEDETVMPLNPFRIVGDLLREPSGGSGFDY